MLYIKAYLNRFVPVTWAGKGIKRTIVAISNMCQTGLTQVKTLNQCLICKQLSHQATSATASFHSNQYAAFQDDVYR